jgi:hypothetical protein
MSRTAIVYADVQDGYIYGRNAVYATARSTSAGFDTGGDEVFVGRSIDAGDYVNWRGFLLFDLSQLPSAAIKHITQVRLALLASHKEEVGTARPLILLETYNWAYPIAAGNREASYDALTQEGGSGSGDYFEYMVGSNADLANWVVGQWYFYTFEATFLPYLDTLGSGLLRLGMIHERPRRLATNYLASIPPTTAPRTWNSPMTTHINRRSCWPRLASRNSTCTTKRANSLATH